MEATYHSKNSSKEKLVLLQAHQNGQYQVLEIEKKIFNYGKAVAKNILSQVVLCSQKRKIKHN